MPEMAKTYSIDLLSEENVKKYVLPHYGMDNAEITQIKFKDTDKQRAVYRVDFSGNSYCLKKIYFSQQDLLFVYSAIEWLYRHGINVPKILPTKDRNRFVEYKDMLFILTPWIEGIKCSYDNIENVLDASKNLARIHLVSENFIPIEGSSMRTGFENLPNSINKHFEQILLCSNQAFRYGDKFSKLFLQNFETNLELARISSQAAYNIEMKNLSKSLCHLDYVNKNIIFDADNSLWLIDFDKCRIDYCIHDVSYFLRRLLKRDNTKWDMEMAINCLNLYDEIHKLSFDDYKFLLVYLSFPQKFWKISRDYYNNINKCNKNSFFTLLKKACNKNDYHLQFITEFKTHIEKKFDTRVY